jgi:hypothetical protein
MRVRHTLCRQLYGRKFTQSSRYRHGLCAKQSPVSKNVSTEAEDTVGIRYQATTGEDTEDWEDLESVVVICKVYKSVRLF